MRKSTLKAILTVQITSLRTALSTTGMVCVQVMSKRLGRQFQQLEQGFMPALFEVCNRKNNVFVKTAQETVTTIIRESCVPRQIPALQQEMARSRNQAYRSMLTEFMYLILDANDQQELTQYVPQLTAMIQERVVDAGQEARESARRSFHRFRALFPEDAERYRH